MTYSPSAVEKLEKQLIELTQQATYNMVASVKNEAALKVFSKNGFHKLNVGKLPENIEDAHNLICHYFRMLNELRDILLIDRGNGSFYDCISLEIQTDTQEGSSATHRLMFNGKEIGWACEYADDIYPAVVYYMIYDHSFYAKYYSQLFDALFKYWGSEAAIYQIEGVCPSFGNYTGQHPIYPTKGNTRKRKQIGKQR